MLRVQSVYKNSLLLSPNFKTMKKSLSLVSLILFLFACGEDGVNAPAGTMVADFGGSSSTSVAINATLTGSSSEELVIVANFTIGGKAQQLLVNVEPFGSVLEKEYVMSGNDPSTTDAALIYIPDPNAGAYYSTSVDESNAGKVTITKLDKTNKVVSGTFEGKVQRGTEVVLMSGSFSKIPYTP
jgi:hypothetical protein